MHWLHLWMCYFQSPSRRGFKNCSLLHGKDNSTHFLVSILQTYYHWDWINVFWENEWKYWTKEISKLLKLRSVGLLLFLGSISWFTSTLKEKHRTSPQSPFITEKLWYRTFFFQFILMWFQTYRKVLRLMQRSKTAMSYHVTSARMAEIKRVENN